MSEGEAKSTPPEDWPRVFTEHINAGDLDAVVALYEAEVYTDFDGTAVDASGNPADVHHKAIEVLRRQPEGTWKLIVGDPHGRE